MRLPVRAEVTPEFIDLMIEIYSAWLSKIQETGGRIDVAGRCATNIKRILPIVRRKSPELHLGLDYEITRLRGSEYTRFYTYSVKGRDFLVGATKHITLVPYTDRDRVEAELGTYHVYIPREAFAKSDLRCIHMIPDRNQKSVFRHPHHYVAKSDRKVVDDKFVPIKHPLLADTGNCWSSVGDYAKGILDDPDVPDIFRLLQYHLTTRGSGPPVQVRELDFDNITPEAK